jgi:hypothetical protein
MDVLMDDLMYEIDSAAFMAWCYTARRRCDYGSTTAVRELVDGLGDLATKP